ncbi:hypothetical protein A2930_00945 [Candidatus Giovannonibacteria bacterium RIFCSPLOWO2_01_FULL_45_34]|uniref:Uncharacterized protein n=1 Tax=Candidatus Giovannonibacteria bacterium RIFCSPLOWO2_01_FULL_45_34 TaxID=1798351 RepID=A0A1F5WY58_9BACT|nr:MAG: hypothetical protein A3C73_00395 [Candidatus Giovannonibacteria bacterium RIFCSPHIGHO2_02_FULL_44_11]OGF80578.1 MAG: hypothetical protein A2930_00945 [Candidatus Giovannonibacteria bacterium RIFCSPLOWO2_01_FULL_45_34]
MKTTRPEIRAHLLLAIGEMANGSVPARKLREVVYVKSATPIELRLRGLGLRSREINLLMQNMFEWLNKREPVEYVSGEKLRTLL